MVLLRRLFLGSPWLLVRLFAPLMALVPFAVYWHTLVRHVQPGLPAYLTAAAAGLCQTQDLSHPLFSLLTREIAALPYGDLVLRLNLFTAFCAALAVSFFYLFTARLIFMFAGESPGGLMSAMPPQALAEDAPAPRADSAAREDALSYSEMPVMVQEHNLRVAYAALFGGLGAALAFAFCAPFWLAATRLYPYAFDLALLFLLLNLLFSYEQRGRLAAIYPAAFLLGVGCVESPLHLLLLPLGAIFLLRSMMLNEHISHYRVLGLLLCGGTGLLLAAWNVLHEAKFCAALPYSSMRATLRLLEISLRGEVIRWIPSFGWSYAFAQFLFPLVLAFFIFSYSFWRRTTLLLLLQIAMVALLLPNLLNFNSDFFQQIRMPGLANLLRVFNLDASLWGVARLASRVPVYQYTVLALFAGLLIAVWHLMGEAAKEMLDDELDFYEYRDSPWVCRVGSILCWPLLLLMFVVPLRGFDDIDPHDGSFADEIADAIYNDLEGRDWLVNSRLLQHHLMLRAHRDGRSLKFIAIDSGNTEAGGGKLVETINSEASFDGFRSRLVNAADLSAAAFLREWLNCDTNAYRRIALFNVPSLWSKNGYTAVPRGLFLEGLPLAPAKVDTASVLVAHQDFRQRIYPLVMPGTEDAIRHHALLRRSLRGQLALMGNELAALLVAQDDKEGAAELYKRAEMLAPDNLSVALNRYELILNGNVNSEALSLVETRLRQFPQQMDVFSFSVGALQDASGTQLNPDMLDHARKHIWVRGNAAFRNLTAVSGSYQPDPLAALRIRKRELVQKVSQLIDACEMDDANRNLDALLDIDESDPFVLVNKARIAIARRDLPEAGVWLDLAREHGVPEMDLAWHEASLLLIKGERAAARELLNKAVLTNRSDIYLWGLLAEILLEEGEFAELESRVYPVLCSVADRKEHYLVYLVRGYLHKHSGVGEYHQARVSFLRALALNRHLDKLREELLEIDRALNVPAFCEEDAKRVLRVEPDHAYANALWGMVRLGRGELDLAEDLFKRSLAKSREELALSGMGAVLMERGDLKAAERLLREALGLDSTTLFTRHALARLAMMTDRLDEAGVLLAQLMSAHPESLELRITQIRLLLKQGRTTDAAMLVSDLMENEDLLPTHIRHDLKPLAQSVSAALQM